MDAANRHVEALRTMPLPDVKAHLESRTAYQTMFWSFLAGWDAAMELNNGELHAENHALHERIFETEYQKLKHHAP